MINPSTIDLLTLPSVALADRKQLPEIPCIYFAIDGLNQVQYIGRSNNLRQRWLVQHHRQKQVHGCRIAYIQCDPTLLSEVETALIEWFQPLLNGTLLPKASNSIFVSKVSELRKAQGLTQQQLATELGVSLSTVRNWETGRQAVDTFVKIDRLCGALNAKPSDLYDSVDPLKDEVFDETTNP